MRTVDVIENLSYFYNNLCDEINITGPIFNFTTRLLEINILLEKIGRLLSSNFQLPLYHTRANSTQFTDIYSQKTCIRSCLECFKNLGFFFCTSTNTIIINENK